MLAPVRSYLSPILSDSRTIPRPSPSKWLPLTLSLSPLREERNGERGRRSRDVRSGPFALVLGTNLVGFPPGGAADIIARLYGQSLSARLGKPVVIENRPGSGGNLAGDAVVKSAPDGYTLMHGSDNVFLSNPHVYARMPFDPLRDLAPVASLTSNQLVLAVHPAVPAANLREFVELARRSKPPLFYASIGNGSQHHLAMEMFKQHLGIDLMHVPYRGGGPAAIALLAGDISAMFGGGSIVPTIHSAQLLSKLKPFFFFGPL